MLFCLSLLLQTLKRYGLCIYEVKKSMKVGYSIMNIIINKSMFVQILFFFGIMDAEIILWLLFTKF
jgi:hypothetical protein